MTAALLTKWQTGQKNPGIRQLGKLQPLQRKPEFPDSGFLCKGCNFPSCRMPGFFCPVCHFVSKAAVMNQEIGIPASLEDGIAGSGIPAVYDSPSGSQGSHYILRFYEFFIDFYRDSP